MHRVLIFTHKPLNSVTAFHLLETFSGNGKIDSTLTNIINLSSYGSQMQHWHFFMNEEQKASKNILVLSWMDSSLFNSSFRTHTKILYHFFILGFGSYFIPSTVLGWLS